MKLWIDDCRPAPDGYFWLLTVEDTILTILACEELGDKIEVIDIDHDAGNYVKYGGDYIKLLDWLEATGRNYPIRIHSMNAVGRENMLRICRKNNWTILN